MNQYKRNTKTKDILEGLAAALLYYVILALLLTL